MALIICSECGKEYSDKAVSCPSCGCPTVQQSPPIVIADDTPSQQEQTVRLESIEQGNSEKPKGRFTVGFIIILILIVMSSIISSDKNKTELPKLSYYQAGKICRYYVGNIMSRNPTTINHYKTDENGNVYVSYVRTSDNTEWSYVCSLKDNNLVWAAWLNDTKEWGRWRNEDKVSFRYISLDNVVKFKDRYDDSDITVSLN